MMLGDELKASWNQRSRTLVLHHVEPTALQTAVLRYAARVGSFLESNEALLESRFGNFAYKHDGKEGGKDEYASRDGKDGPRKFDNKRRNDRGPPGSHQQQRRDGEGGQGDRSYDDDDSRNRGSYRRRPYTNK
jgi:hypothetical protein